jgi:hypothetical protein
MLKKGPHIDLVGSHRDKQQNDGKLFLLKMKSLRAFQIAQTKAHTPTLMWRLSFLANPFNQFPIFFDILEGGVALKVIYTMRQMTYANMHIIKRCSIVAYSSQKQYLVQPCNFLFSKLSVVRINPMKKPYKNPYSQRDLNFQMYFLRYIVRSFSKFRCWISL